MMMIVTSDSCKTLIQFDDHHHDEKTTNDWRDLDNDVSSIAPATSCLVATNLLLPNDFEDEYDDDTDDDSYNYYQKQTPSQQQRIYLPQQLLVQGQQQPNRTKKLCIDDYLRCIPQIVERNDELLANPVRYLSPSCKERFVYVAQAEVAHATSQQCDVLVSDRATTCHILAIRSTTTTSNNDNNATVVLGSMAHMDGTCYEDGIRDMIQQHRLQHQSHYETNIKTTLLTMMVHMDVHILGGYHCDASRDISNWIMTLLSQLAMEHRHWLRMTLGTCAISSMNDNGHACPMGRGLGLDLKTGRVSLAKVVDRQTSSPALAMRSARLWTITTLPDGRRRRRRQLGLIHAFSDETIRIDPILLPSSSSSSATWKLISQVDLLLRLPNHVLVQLVSTSPHAEEDIDEFCHDVRETLECLKQTTTATSNDPPLIFRRVASTNVWKLTATTTATRMSASSLM
jgi:protein N-terminal asparagine amidohydrolase